tara:strand:+ start:490 stop:699 length:210 start_codon:yes stop_codon:yes gene_type:complete
MYGFSFPKLLLLLIILIVIWNFFKYMEKKDKNSIKEKDNNEEELTECNQCGGFYDKSAKSSCPMCNKIN